MDRLSAWQSVQVVNEKSEWHGRAGTVQGYDGDNPRVRFDALGDMPEETAAVPQADLRVL